MKQIYITRFHTKYEVNTNTGCWEWQAGKINGYGTFWAGENWASHRFSAMIHGLDMSKPVVRHKCDNPACVNPAHLETGTHQDNMDDKVKRGRASSIKGSSNVLSVLSEAQVLAIRSEYWSNPYRGAMAAIAKKYQISTEQVRRIIRRIDWRHI